MSDYFEVESRLQEALEYKRQHPQASFRWLGSQFNVHKGRLHRRWKGTQKSRSAHDPTNLTYQDKALCWYTVLPQAILLTKKRKEEADRTAINCQRRATNRVNRKRKLDEMEQDEKEEVEE
jgi:hypothetical protein